MKHKKTPKVRIPKNYKNEIPQFDIGGSMLQGAATGASTGMALGPWGALIGGVAGAAYGAYTGSEQDKVQKGIDAQNHQADINAQAQQQSQMKQQAFNNQGQMYAAMGGIKYPNGGMQFANSEVEKQENSIAPDGEFTQYNGRSHANGGIKTNLEPGEIIFSDKLKLGKKTFAQLNKSNNTNKEDKILESGKYSNISTRTAEIMKMAKLKNSQDLFKAQEDLKQSKVQAYAKRMGVTLPQPSMDNEQAEPQGQSEQSEGEYKMGGYKLYPNGGEYPAMTNPYHHFKGAIPMYGNGGEKPKVSNLINNTAANTNSITPSDSIYATNTTTNDMTPSQWATFNTSKNYTVSPAQTQSPYKDYYDSSKYNAPKVTDGNYTFYKNGDEGKTVDYNNDPTYKPFESYGGKKLNDAKPAQWNTTTILRDGTQKRGYPDGHSEIVGQPRKVVPLGGFKYGGMMPKFDDGGEYDNEELPIRRSTNDLSNQELQGNPQIQDVGYGKGLGDDDPSNQKDNQPNWKDTVGNVANFAAQNAGNIYDLTRKNAPLTTYQRAQASYLDPTAALRDAQQQNNTTNANLRDASGGNAGTYLANRLALNSQNVTNKDRIRQEYGNANAQIGNQNAQFNTEIAYREREARDKDAAMKQNVNSQAVHSMASNFGKFSKSGKQDDMDQNTLETMMKYYNNPEFQKIMKNNSMRKSKSKIKG